MDLESLLVLATKARHLYFDPGEKANGACHVISTVLITMLESQGQRADLVSKTFCCTLHYYVKLGNIVIDCTGDQFGSGMPPIFIGSELEHRHYDMCEDAKVGVYFCEHDRGE